MRVSRCLFPINLRSAYLESTGNRKLELSEPQHANVSYILRRSASVKLRVIVPLLLLTAAAFAIHGYHPAVEDAEIYVPAIQKILDPALFPFNQEFFETHARMTFFPNLIASSVRISHVSLEFALLFWYTLTVFLLLTACWKLAEQLFDQDRARWAGSLATALLTLPVAGTAIYIMDDYLNPRSIALVCAAFAIENALKKRYVAVAAWTLLGAAVHPLMSVFALSLIAVIVWFRDFGGYPMFERAAPAAACLLPLGILSGSRLRPIVQSSRLDLTFFCSNGSGTSGSELLGLLRCCGG